MEEGLIIEINNNASESTNTTSNHELEGYSSDVMVYEMDGHVFKVRTVFAKGGRTILENIISYLLDKMEHSKEK